MEKGEKRRKKEEKKTIPGKGDETISSSPEFAVNSR
jgi:hypothetical protein